MHLQEFYWTDDDSSNVPTWYNVVFFEGKGESVTRAWVRTEDVKKMVEPVEQQVSAVKCDGKKKLRLKAALAMAEVAVRMKREDRLDKYSFASLFKGKWGKFSDLWSEDDLENNVPGSPVKRKKIELIKTPRTAPQPSRTKSGSAGVRNRKSSGFVQNIDRNTENVRSEASS